ncbi:hypothetical protein L596_002758 [Steinernema carpocapsae]|uniref:Uncharacterized protein n=1 Tax=Steinernema carpocapsae TaxID=34508 RepID=A0A4U8UQF9_STECR|nr:hypothetical protein L596_002758 [Steinernema carpocapsae]
MARILRGLTAPSPLLRWHHRSTRSSVVMISLARFLLLLLTIFLVLNTVIESVSIVSIYSDPRLHYGLSSPTATAQVPSPTKKSD